MLLRWSLWGHKPPDSLIMLRDSVASFRRFFRDGADYVVLTDEVDIVASTVRSLASVRGFHDFGASAFDAGETATWRKWAPIARLAPGDAEVTLDSDVFCVGEPTELKQFCALPGDSICSMQESLPDWWCFGVFHEQLRPTLPCINAGLVAQQRGANIHERLRELFTWWRTSVLAERETPHDEQGAFAVLWAEAARLGKVFPLPTSRYLLTSPRTNPDLCSLDGLAIIHATFPNHPKYWQFQAEIRRIYDSQ